MSALSEAIEYLQAARDGTVRAEELLTSASSTCGKFANSLSVGGFKRAAGTLATVGQDLDETIAALSSAVSRTNSTLHTVANADAANLDEAANAIATSDAQLSELRNITGKSSITVSRSLLDISRLGKQNPLVQQITESLQQVTTLFDSITAQHHSTDHAIDKAHNSLSNNTPNDHGTTDLINPRKGGRVNPVNASKHISWSDLFHVLHGDPDDPESGGHLYGLGRPGKTEFPKDWDEEDIREALLAVANTPEKMVQNDTNWLIEGWHRGCLLRVFVRDDGSVEAGFPLKKPGVRKDSGKS